MAAKILKVKITTDEFTDFVANAFDYNFDGTSEFMIPEIKPLIPSSYRLGLIVGASGSGKSSILKEIFKYDEKYSHVSWDRSKAIISHFSSPKEAVDKCFAAGLGSIPSLTRPYHVLSTGEKYRALMARLIKSGMILDEYTSVVNRETAFSLSVSLRKYINKNNLEHIVLASCHKDIIDYLSPDWIYDTDYKEMIIGKDAINEYVKKINISKKEDSLDPEHETLIARVSWNV